MTQRLGTPALHNTPSIGNIKQATCIIYIFLLTTKSGWGGEKQVKLSIFCFLGIFKSLLKVKVKSLSRVRLFVTPWTVAYQAPPFIGFSWQEYWSGLPFPSPGDLPNPGIEPGSPAFQADTLTSEPPGKPIIKF